MHDIKVNLYSTEVLCIASYSIPSYSISSHHIPFHSILFYIYLHWPTVQYIVIHMCTSSGQVLVPLPS